jgi:hypothetical protein
MNSCIRTKTLTVDIQENGIIRNKKGYLIGRLSDEVDFDGEHIVEKQVVTNLPTAEELFLKTTFPTKFKENPEEVKLWLETNPHAQDAIKLMIDFARIQVQAALEARDRLYQDYYEEEIKWTEHNIKFIKDSYPLSNIK